MVDAWDANQDTMAITAQNNAQNIVLHVHKKPAMIVPLVTSGISVKANVQLIAKMAAKKTLETVNNV